MVPADLSAESFAKYPPLAKQIAAKNLALLRGLPGLFIPLLLRELISYDWSFPAERNEFDQQLVFLNSLDAGGLRQAMARFSAIELTPKLRESDWVDEPTQFSENLSAYLWSSNQIDAFRAASVEYVHLIAESAPPKRLPTYRVAIVVVGEGVSKNTYPLFRKLRGQGVYFSNVDPKDGRKILFDALTERAQRYPLDFGHWYIEGASIEAIPANDLVCVSYRSLDQVRANLLSRMRTTMQPGGGGPEQLRSLLARVRPSDLGMREDGSEGVLNRFQVSILSEGSGTQLFSTTFVQWTAREALRRAQPLTLFARFAPRRREQGPTDLDPEGSLIDADMAAYYTWIGQQRLTGADQARFLVWFEDHNEALAIAPHLARGTSDASRINLGDVLQRMA